MAESAEHQFLSHCVTTVLSQMSRTHLYAYVEAERRKFDFACELMRDWSRPLVGQTLWNHIAGVDKDLRTMLLDEDAEICIYIVKDIRKARRLISEVMQDFGSGRAALAPHRLKIIPIPSDFDADSEDDRQLVTRILWDSVSRDILMNIVFGNLTAEDVRFFIKASGRPGLHFALLYHISTSQRQNLPIKELATRFGVSQQAVRERLIRLLGCGFLTSFGGGLSGVKVTPKGRFFLDLCRELRGQTSTGRLTEEMLQILRLLAMGYDPSAVAYSAQSLNSAGPMLTEVVPEMVTGRLLATIAVAIEKWGVDLEAMRHVPLAGSDAIDSLVRDLERLRQESANQRSSK